MLLLKAAVDSFFREQFKKSHKTLRKAFFSLMLVILTKKIFEMLLLLYWPRCRVLSKRSNYSFFRRALWRKSIKYNVRLLFSGNINGNKNITWQNKYYSVIWIPTFMLIALPRCWQLSPIMASQHNEWCHKVSSFPVQKFFWLPILKKWHHKMARLSKIMPMLLDIK